MSSLLGSISSGIRRESQSFKAPDTRDVGPPPVVGAAAPSSDKLFFPNGKPTIVVFLRHCGCPFAEKTFNDLITISNKYPQVRCVAVSHSSREATDKWLVDIGGQWDVIMMVDPNRDLYSLWGLGLSTTWHLLNPWSLASSINLARSEGIWTRATESGTRWQVGGAFAVDSSGVVRWAHVARTASDMSPFNVALKALDIT